MPTGYTAKVADGTITSLKDYALICARAMGALVTMRDLPADAPIPKILEPNDYYSNKIAETKSRMTQILGLSDAESELFARTEYLLKTEEYNKERSKQEKVKSRYEAMIAQVESWDCKAEGLKDFMLGQLRSGLDFDYVKHYNPEPEKITGKEWLEKTLNELEKALAYYQEGHEKEIARTNDRNRWLKALWESLVTAKETE